MPWFECGDCGESVKKPKIDAHKARCSSSHFTCLDCSRTFGRNDVKAHTSCVTEHDKYAGGATKPGGFAAAGFYGDTTQRPTEPGQPEGTQYLSKGPPWVCSICKVTCTSQQTLEGHASGAKHKRRARAAANAAQADSAAPLKGAEVGAAAPAKAQSAPDSTDGNGHADYPTVSPTSDLQRCNGMNGIAEHAAPANGKVSKAVRRPKFKKLAKIHLRAQSLGSMKLKKLQKKLLSGVGNADLQDELMRTLRKSSQFKIEGERISLAST